MKQPIAIIDCGTNTFTLSIGQAGSSPEQLDMSLKARHFVELAVGGINTISSAAFERGLRAFEDFADILKDYPNAKVMALGTAALRNATNAKDFVAAAKAVSNIDIQIILQEPKLFEYLHIIEENISKLLKLNIKNINVKVTSTDGLGLIGSGDGIATLCAVNLIKK